jgi:D-alanine-D-alanine ligase
MADKALDVIEIVAATRFYDYEAKYAPGGSRHLLPAPVSPIVYQEVRRLALKAHQPSAVEACLALIFLRRPERTEDWSVWSQHAARHDGNLVCAELANHAGLTFDELVRWMVEDASLNR